MVDINNHIEVSAISESCQILSDTLNLVEKSIAPGQSVLELDNIAQNYILSCEAKPAFKGYNGFPSTLTVSIDDEIVHGIPKDILLEETGIDRLIELSTMKENSDEYNELYNKVIQVGEYKNP